jgi:glucose/arabinose dehydrogenase
MRTRLAWTLALILAAAGCGDDGGDDDTNAGDSGPTPDGPSADARILPDAAVPSCSPTTGTTVTAEEVAGGFAEPVLVTAPAGDARLFVVEQTGRIEIIEGGTVLPTPFLDLGPQGEDLITRDGNEQGLLGLAFHPDFAQNQRFYVNYSDRLSGGDTIVAEYTVSADLNVADAASRRPIITVEQDFSNHNGGMIAFAPDGTLWIGMGDGGSSNDPNDRAEDETQLLGKMLRIDVDGGDPYAIPSDNPFADSANGEEDPRPEIWALGLRNPWRWSFDPEGGVVYIGDVGQDAREEINAEPIASAGLDYGWDIWEGNRCNEPPQGGTCEQEGYTFPVVEYDQGGGRCSVTGGYLYRGSCMQDLIGWYFYADFCSNQYWRILLDNSGDLVEGPVEISNQIGVSNPTSFGVDGTGEMYVVSRGGTIYRLAVAP